jgi:hypothetical protein
MSVPTNVHAFAIRRAAQAMGSVEALRAYLQVSMTELNGWMAGEGLPPDAVFLRIVDLLSEQELARLKQGRGPGTASSGNP